jgi:hypothetical protein
MKNDKPIEISIKTIFTGTKSAQQVFIDLMRRQINHISRNRLELIPTQMYNEAVVFPGVHNAPEREICYE